jgi:hypothetical protein
LLRVLGELVARGGTASLMLPPVAPGDAAFPEPWAASAIGVQRLLRRLLWHAAIDRVFEIEDRRTGGAPPTERKPSTRVELVDVDHEHARFVLEYLGEDDIVGTIAHEVGTLYAVLHRPDGDDPYRTAKPPLLVVDPDLDPPRGAVATVYRGLGVLAANAAYQQYSRGGRFNGAYVPLEYDVLCAGALPLSALAFLVAVQAVVRGDSGPPKGLGGPQRDEVVAWMRSLARRRDSLRERLGIGANDPAPPSRPVAEPFDDEPLPTTDDQPVEDADRSTTAFRWQTHRGGVGLVAGAVVSVGVAFAISRGLAPLIVCGGAGAGHAIGRRVRVPRCSACATIVSHEATSCRRCGAHLRGDIASLRERLEAEERLEQDSG